jgi:hypothetical protein
MPNTSATGGYLQPTVILDKNDQELHRFLQQLVSGITGIEGALVRPRWQAESVTAPDFTQDWVAIGEIRRTPDFNTNDFSSSSVSPIPDSKYRNEVLEILCSFYGPNAEQKSELLSIGFQVDQNREQMQLNGFGLVGVEDAVILPALVHSKWRYRVDLNFRIRRAQEYTFGILDIVAADILIKDDSGAVNLDVDVNTGTVQTAPLLGFDLQSSIYGGWDNGHWR